jgi:hypothetical protein
VDVAGLTEWADRVLADLADHGVEVAAEPPRLQRPH